MTFRQKPALNAHLRLHKDERPYSCSICGTKFKKSTFLKRHMEVHNEGGSHQKNLDMLDFTSSVNDETPVINAIHNKCPKNESSEPCVQALKQDPEMSSDIFSCSQEEEDQAVYLQEAEVTDEFVSIKEEMVLPENEGNKRNKVNVLEGVNDTRGSSNRKSLGPESLNVDFLL
ncbi:hypothetical protein SK128_021907, partial [Halocaridina rubra]